MGEKSVSAEKRVSTHRVYNNVPLHTGWILLLCTFMRIRPARICRCLMTWFEGGGVGARTIQQGGHSLLQMSGESRSWGLGSSRAVWQVGWWWWWPTWWGASFRRTAVEGQQRWQADEEHLPPPLLRRRGEQSRGTQRRSVRLLARKQPQPSSQGKLRKGNLTKCWGRCVCREQFFVLMCFFLVSLDPVPWTLELDLTLRLRTLRLCFDCWNTGLVGTVTSLLPHGSVGT